MPQTDYLSQLETFEWEEIRIFSRDGLRELKYADSSALFLSGLQQAMSDADVTLPSIKQADTADETSVLLEELREKAPFRACAIRRYIIILSVSDSAELYSHL